ncbi:PadR family transcriptional regulator [Priestia sp. SIMBA_032]|uniref:PadR family transcriptional regulator n=1 Tax=Priestia sp. SIMBA_032 TaxID=3085775 RepID=UPI00397D7346
MNTLGYAILSTLASDSCSGYELVNHLEVMWPAKHSQVYPLLKIMENKKLVTSKSVEQVGKPDKKIYSITEKGKKELEEWLITTSSNPVVRDEFLIKMYSIWLVDQKQAKDLVQKRVEYLAQKLENELEKVVVFEMNAEQKQWNIKSKTFRRYILSKREIKLYEDEIGWCKWIMSFINKTNNKHFVLGIAGVKLINQLLLGII